MSLCQATTQLALRCPKLHRNDLALLGIGGNKITNISFITVNIEILYCECRFIHHKEFKSSYNFRE